MLSIRLSRIGKKKKPMYRITVAEKTKDPYGRALEILGSYNPFSKELVVKKDRVEHHLANGAQMTKTVNNLLIEHKIIQGDKVSASKPGKKKEAEENTEEKPASEEKKEEAPKEEEAKKE